MHHAVTDGGNVRQRPDDPGSRVDQFVKDSLDGHFMVGDVDCLPDFFTIGRLVNQHRIPHADTLDQTDRHPALARHVEQLILER